MKSFFLAAIAALATLVLFSSAPANAQNYRESYYHDSHSGAAHVVGALIELAAHRAHDRRSNYYGGGYVRDPDFYRYDYAPRYRDYGHYNNYGHYNRYNSYNSFPAYQQRHHYQSHRGIYRRHHGRRH